MPTTHSRASLWLGLASVLPLAVMLAAALGTRAGLWSYGIGLKMLPAAAGLGLLVALVALWLGWRRRPGGPALGTCILASLIALAPAVHVASLVMKARSLPRIHDISTDLEDPPAFLSQAIREAPRQNSLAFDAEATAAAQREAYPGVAPLISERGCDALFAEAYNLAVEKGWDIAEADPDAAYVEATATTFWFGFRDDVVIRLQPRDGGCRVDMRSISRVGLSDVGANAARIEAFMERLR